MTEIIVRNYLEIKSLNDLIKGTAPQLECSIKFVKPFDFQINKFFYKNIGKNHRWTDRLVWSEKNWIEYISNSKVETYIMEAKNDLVGYFELIFHLEKKEVEIAYLGILEEYLNKKLGSYLLATAIKKSFEKKNINRVWVHTCTLDHDNAIKNYLARGMTIFKKETIKI